MRDRVRGLIFTFSQRGRPRLRGGEGLSREEKRISASRVSSASVRTSTRPVSRGTGRTRDVTGPAGASRRRRPSKTSYFRTRRHESCQEGPAPLRPSTRGQGGQDAGAKGGHYPPTLTPSEGSRHTFTGARRQEGPFELPGSATARDHIPYPTDLRRREGDGPFHLCRTRVSLVCVSAGSPVGRGGRDPCLDKVSRPKVPRRTQTPTGVRVTSRSGKTGSEFHRRREGGREGGRRSLQRSSSGR